jgi:tetratricopeptide (TPR) repeat protein
MLAHQTNDRKKAFGCGRRLVELDPTSHTGAIVGAINGFYLAEFAEALKLVDAALAAHPGDRTAHIVRCGVLTDLGRYDEAIADADAALAGERDAMVVNMKAFALAAADRAAEAKANYEEALALIDAGLVESPDDGDVVSRRAYALVGLGRGEEALGAAERALELVDDSFLTLQSLGRAHLLVGKPEAAIEPLEKARAQREAAPLASYYLALAFARCDRREDARAALVDAARSPHFVAQAKREPLLAALL